MSDPSFHSDFFNIPDGAELSHAIFTTMSLDCGVMERMAAMCLSPGLEKLDRKSLSNVLNCARRRVRFFYDAKDICRKLDNCRFSADITVGFRLLAVPVTGYNSEYFHPKIILLHFIREGKAFFRLMVSSKNLTWADSFETGVWLESVPAEDQTSLNHNLPDFLDFLEKYSDKNESSDIEDFIQNVKKELECVNFVLPKEKDTTRVQVVFSGRKDGLPAQDELIAQIIDHNTKKFRANPDLVILSPDYETSTAALCSGGTDKDAAGLCLLKPVEEDFSTELPTHGKLYYNTETHTLWTGSSNCSFGGLENNIECMVRVKGAEDVWKEGNPQDTLRTGRLFGQCCIQYTDFKSMDSNPLALIMNQFLKDFDFKLSEELTRDNKRHVKVTVQHNGDSEPTFCPDSYKGVIVEVLPFGMKENASATAVNDTKWKKVGVSGADAQNISFTGNEGEAATWMLRIRISVPELKLSMERVWCAPLTTDVIQDIVDHSDFDDLVNHSWLDEFHVRKDNTADLNLLLDMLLDNINYYESKLEAGSLKMRRLQELRKTAWQYYIQYGGNKMPQQVVTNNELSSVPSCSGYQNYIKKPDVEAPAVTGSQHPTRYQQDAINSAVSAFTEGRTRYLVADEAGLGKTHVARGVIRKYFEIWKTENPDKPFVVYYFCSGMYLADDTIKKLTKGMTDVKWIKPENIEGTDRQKRMLYNRPSMAALFNEDLEADKINLFGFSANLLPGGRSLGEASEVNLLVKEDIVNGVRFNDIEQEIVNGLRSDEKLTDYSRNVKQLFLPDLIDKLRWNFMKQAVAPAMIIVDEFHRYDQLLFRRDDQLFDQTIPKLQQMFGNAKLLMLSATPYNIYGNAFKDILKGTDEEEEDTPSYNLDVFSKLLEFLLKGDINSKRAKDVRDHYDKFTKSNVGSVSPADSKKMSDDMSTDLKMYIFRNERIYGISDKYRDLPESISQDLWSACLPTYDVMLEKAEKYGYGRIGMLCPGVYSFPLTSPAADLNNGGKFYAKLSFNQEIMEDDDSFVFKWENDRVRLKSNMLESHLSTRLILDYNARQGIQLLWVPPTHPYYLPAEDSIFAYNEPDTGHKFTKLLLFSGYTLVPRAMAAIFSAYANETNEGNAVAANAQPVTFKELDKKVYSRKILAAIACLWNPTSVMAQPCDINTLIDSIASKQGCKDIAEELEWDPCFTAKYAVASPLVCAYRLWKITDKAMKVAEAFTAYFSKNGIRQAVYANGITDPKGLLDYCLNGNMLALLQEYVYCLGGVGSGREDENLNELCDTLRYQCIEVKKEDKTTEITDTKESLVRIFTKDSALDWNDNNKDSREAVYCLYADRFTADGEDSGASDTTVSAKNHQKRVQAAFNSPFWPMILCTSSKGQEGIDLDRYCMRIMHYSLPPNPMSFEQRDGRIDRRLSLLARRKMERMWQEHFPEKYLSWNQFWEWIFSQDTDESGLSPKWCQTFDNTELKQERLLPFFPFSENDIRYNRLLAIKNIYRSAFGIPNEQELNEQIVYPLHLNEL